MAVLLAALCFATTGTARELADTAGDPLSVGAARVLVGGGLLGLVALVRYARLRAAAGTGTPVRPPDQPDRTAAPQPRPRVPAWVVVLVGAVGVLAYQPSFFAGTRANGVAVGTIVALGSAPLVTGVLDAVVRRRRPTTRWCTATAVAVAGLALVAGLVGGVAVRSPAGVLASLGAGLAYAVYAMASKLLLDRGWSVTAAVGGIFGWAAVLALPVLLTTPTGWLATPGGVALTLWLGVVTVAVAYLLFAWGLRRLAPTTVATLTLAEPLGATLLGLALLGERLATPGLVGLGLLAVGLVLVTLPGRTGRTERRVPAPA